MVLEILGGALLGKALQAKKLKTKTEKAIEPTAQSRYAVAFETKSGKGAGSFGVVYLTSDYADAMKWAENAAYCVASIYSDGSYISSVKAEGRVLGGYRAVGDGKEQVYCVVEY